MSYPKMILVPLLLGYCLLTAPVSVKAVDDEVFVGTTPCEARYRAEHEVPIESPCEMIKWELKLSGKPKTNTGRFRFSMRYGMSQPNTNDVRDGGTLVQAEGKWVIRNDRSNFSSLLLSQSGKPAIVLRRIGDGLLHFVDSGGRLMVGHGGWSYTLNRASASSSILPDPGRFKISRDVPAPLSGRFVGRSPCQDLAEILGHPNRPDCIKIKWDFRFEPDPNDGQRGKFTLRHTFIRDTFALSGNFQTLKQEASSGSSVVYRLTFPTSNTGTILLMRTSEETIVFLDGDARARIGNGDFGYTLNRSE